MLRDSDLSLFLISFIIAVAVNCFLFCLGNYFMSEDTSDNSGRKRRRKSIATALFVYMLILALDILYILWLYDGGHGVLPRLINLSQFYDW